MTLTIAVVVSAIVSLTLTPMMCAMLLKHVPNDVTQRPGIFARAIDATVEFYMRTLGIVLRFQRLTLLLTFLTLLLTIALYVIVPKGFLPAQDTGLITAVIQAGPEVSFDEMTRLQGLVTTEIRKDPDVDGVVSVIGVSSLNTTPNAGSLKITLKPRSQRQSSAADIIPRLERAGATIPGVLLFFQSVQDIQIATRATRAQYQFTLTGSDGGEVNRWAETLRDKLAGSGILRNLTVDTQDGGLRAFVKLDRDSAGRLGVSMQALNDALNDAFGQRQISTIYAQSNQYRVVLEAMPQYQSDPEALGRLFVPSVSGAQVPLNSIAKINRIQAPLTNNHQEQFPAATLSFNLAPGAALGDAVAAIDAAQKSSDVPGLLVGTYSGDAAEFSKSLASQPWLILAALVTIYIVLGVLYESFIHPFTILTTLPSAGIGAVLALMICRIDLSLVALIGIVLLMGIVKKNAIMMIDFALDAERTRGLTPEQSIIEACRLRFRPIMMTTLAALFGALPLALESGTGSELRYPLGVTIIGGLLLSQMLTLYTTPVIYLAMERLRARIATGRPAANSDLPAVIELPRRAAE